MAPREPIEIPKASDLQAFDHAVAGHAGTLCDATGALFIKPCVQKEINFYDAVAQGHPELADILPVYMGTLSLNQQATPEQALEQIQQTVVLAHAQSLPPPPEDLTPEDNITWIPNGGGSIATDRAIVLENATHGFKHPNVLDIKLGQRLWADNAPLQKRQRMDEIARKTTHKNFGFRIAGMRVWNGKTAEETTEKTTEKTTERTTTTTTSPHVRRENGYTIYDKDYGRKEVHDGNLLDAMRQFVFAAAGVDADHGRAIAAAFKANLERVRDVLENEYTRMFSSSLLFVFEGDGDALKLAIAEGNRAASGSASSGASSPRSIYDEAPSKRRRIGSPAAVCDDRVLSANPRRVTLGKATDRSSSRTDSGIVIDDEEDDEDNVSISDSESSESELPRIYSLRLIDFAHARFVSPEEGPDENNLLGVRKLIELFDELAT